MATWDEITSTLKKGVNFVGSKSKELVAITKLSTEVNALKKERTEMLAALGAKVYRLVQEGSLENADLSAEVAGLSDLERKIAEKNEELEEVRKDSPARVTEEKPEIEVLEPEGCGHEIPEGANFCPVCGRRV
ncbi:MAG TPA: zinc-ribbon domain-containing protein [Firmicutes bacterium]|nr:zinc-ribbon domain-containing protein [Bacillota bacterium]